MNPGDFWRLYREVYRRRWLVLTIFGTTLAVVGLGCLLMPRYYRASALVMPSEAALSKPVIPGAGTALSGMGDVRGGDTRGRKEELMATFIGLAQSGEVKERAIESAGVDTTPAQLDDLVKVEPAWGSIIRITCLARTADDAIALANEIAHQFAAYYQEQTGFQARRNRQFLERELAAAKADDDRLKAELQAYKSQHGEAALPVGLAENPFLSQFYSLRSQMDLTNAQLRSVEGRLREVQAQLKKQSPDTEVNVSTTDNPVTTQLQDELARLERELLLARSKYTEKHKRIQDLRTQIADVTERLSRESERMISRRTITPNPIYGDLKQQLVQLSTEKMSLSAQLTALSDAMAENERKAAQLADSSVVLMAKTRDYETSQTRLAVLKQMLDQAKVDEKISSTAGEIQIMDKAKSAVGPVTKSGPSPFQLLLVGFVLSIGLGIGTALALAFLDDRVQAREELSRELSLPVPAVIPQLSDGYAELPAARISDMRPLSPHAEAFRFLRTELTLGAGDPVKSVLVATARPGQGGSTTAANLAVTLAEVGHRVVLVDADMRRPRLHTFFGEDNEAGLTTLLADGQYGAQRALRRTGIANLALLPAGPEVPNPAALLSSERMRRLLADLEAHCDYVVIDTPSAAAFADAVLLGPLVDGVVLVFRANQPVRAVERRTKELFEKVGAKVLGVVLNEAAASNVDSYYFHSHYYPDAPALVADGGPAADVDTRTAPEARPGAGFAAAGAAGPTRTAPPESHAEAAAVPHRAQRRPLLSVLRQHPQFGLFVVGAVTVLLLAVGYTGWRATGHAGRSGDRPRPTPAQAAVSPSVVVRATVAAPTTVRVTVDGYLLHDGPVAPGPQLWEGAEEVTVWAERPEAITSLSVNGHELGPLGPPGAGSLSRRLTAADGPAEGSPAASQPAAAE
ncbi:MAG: polysaccharide biosynthesis tyrosine autokinase [Armatimonadota bacterium]